MKSGVDPFGDTQIMALKTIKALGRKISGYNDQIRSNVREEISKLSPQKTLLAIIMDTDIV